MVPVARIRLTTFRDGASLTVSGSGERGGRRTQNKTIRTGARALIRGLLLARFVPGEARLSEPAAVDQNGNVSSSSSFFLLLSCSGRGKTDH